MPVINHRRPNTQRTCLGGRCCLQCGFRCHRHWIVDQFPQGLRGGETAQQAWERQTIGNANRGVMPNSVGVAGHQAVVQQWGTTTWNDTGNGVVFHAVNQPPRPTTTARRRNNSYDIVRRGTRAPNAAPEAGDRLVTDEEIMQALQPPNVEPF